MEHDDATNATAVRRQPSPLILLSTNSNTAITLVRIFYPSDDKGYILKKFYRFYVLFYVSKSGR